ncbi:MAG: peptidoglycan DD-metalloendopeptidase family protein [Clostridia bacterium]|jgi:murein DD-endopeptidase MepM/ murein hydrolase activator NlpD|nr:peptidoglycan DD-metalloendopeptidase family protein [Clostridia bacterium]
MDNNIGKSQWKTYSKDKVQTKSKKKVKVRNKNKFKFAGILSIVALMLVWYYNPITRTAAYSLDLNGEEVLVSSEIEKAEIQKRVETSLEEETGYNVSVSDNLNWKDVRVSKSSKIYDIDSAVPVIAEAIDYKIKGYAISVNKKEEARFTDKEEAEMLVNELKEENIEAYLIKEDEEFIVYADYDFVLKSKEDAEGVIEKVKLNSYTLKKDEKEEDLIIDFEEDVEITLEEVKEEEILEEDSVFETLTAEASKEKKVYTVVAGDHLDIIAIKNKISKSDLIKLNPGVTPTSIIRIGQKFNLEVPKPFLTVVVRKKVSLVDDIKPEVKIIPREDRSKGYSKIIQKGSLGKKEIEKYIVYRNGIKQGEEIIKEEITKEAKTEIREEGTIPTSSRNAKGSFETPIRVRKVISSRFGYRTLNGRRNFHSGVDFAIDKGTNIYAAKEGKVAFSGWKTNYGYVVYIDHAGGYQTRYAHNSKLLVRTGEKVKRGEIISKSGNSGRSTGPHLHFEIKKDGVSKNPLNYL